MRWLSGASALVVGMLMVTVAGCGSGGGDDLILSFQGFSGEEITQEDSVGSTSADVDVCQDPCLEGDTIVGEPYTQTRLNAVFVNQGKSDIILDRITVSVPDSGIPDRTQSISARVIGGRCESNPEQKCAFDDECSGGSCLHQSTTVNFLLYDFLFKDLVVSGQCPTSDSPGSVIAQTLDVKLTFSGTDETEERFTVRARYQSTFADFDNCGE